MLRKLRCDVSRKAATRNGETGLELQLARLTSEVSQLRAMVQQLLALQGGAGGESASIEEKLAAIRSRGERVSDYLKRNNGRI